RISTIEPGVCSKVTVRPSFLNKPRSCATQIGRLLTKPKPVMAIGVCAAAGTPLSRASPSAAATGVMGDIGFLRGARSDRDQVGATGGVGRDGLRRLTSGDLTMSGPPP